MSQAPVNPPQSGTPVQQPAQGPRARALNFSVHWNDDTTLKEFLGKHVPEPTEPLTTQQREDIKRQTLALKAKLRQVEARLVPNVPAEDHWQVLWEWSKLSFNIKILLWRIFPINDLPPEILANIIRFYVWSPAEPRVGDRNRLCVTSVCRLWRDVAIGDITLWNAIWFRDPPTFERTLLWLERAKDAPLDVRINDIRAMDGTLRFVYNEDSMNVLMDCLVPKLPHVRMLIIILQEWSAASVVLKRLQVAVASGIVPSNFERFEIHRIGEPVLLVGIDQFTPDAFTEPIPLLDGKIPRLNYACLNGVHVDWNLTPFADLTTLDMRHMAMDVCPTVDRFQEMLRGCPRLHKFALDGSGPQMPPDAMSLPIEPVILTRVQVFILGELTLEYALFLMKLFAVPNMRDFTMMNLIGQEFTPMLATMAPMCRHIQLLTMYTTEVLLSAHSEPLFLTWLSSMPELKYLRVARLSPWVFQALLRTVPVDEMQRTGEAALRSQPVCPQLSILEYQYCDIEDVMRFVRTRKEMGAPIKKVYINQPWLVRLSEEDFKRLRELTVVWGVSDGSSTVEENEIMQESAKRRAVMDSMDPA